MVVAANSKTALVVELVDLAIGFPLPVGEG
jgi:hypothetical protein